MAALGDLPHATVRDIALGGGVGATRSLFVKLGRGLGIVCHVTIACFHELVLGCGKVPTAECTRVRLIATSHSHITLVNTRRRMVASGIHSA
jgi:hypothetical protein